MTQNSFHYSEMGDETAQPVFLLDFAAAGEHWTYTTAPYSIQYEGCVYASEPGLVIGDHEVSDNDERAVLEVTLCCSNALVQRLLSDPPDCPIAVTEYKGHADQTYDYQLGGLGVPGVSLGGGHAFTRPWTGWLGGYEIHRWPMATLKCTPYWSDLGIGGDVLGSGVMCQVPLGSTKCGVDLSLWQESGVLLTVSGETITAALFGTHADGYYDGGKIVIGRYSRMIGSHVGTTVVLSHPITGLAAGTAFTCTPGCNHLWDGDCETRYDNQINCRCQPDSPTSNLFKRGIV
ncbi:MAG: phage BR0599 family protein [Phycisphaerales bacterium]